MDQERIFTISEVNGVKGFTERGKSHGVNGVQAIQNVEKCSLGPEPRGL